MTKLVKVSLVVLMGSIMVHANQMKMYDVKSGKITYEIKGSGNIMGQKVQTVGKKRVIFNDYGTKNLTEENKIDKQTVMGNTKNTKTHIMTYMNESMVYHVSFDNKRIMRTENMGAAMGALFGGGQNMKQTAEEMMIKMGGKKIGTDKVLGYTCDIWNLMGTKQCMYKGIPLSIETDVMGIKNREVATKAEFDISLSPNDFKLPDFPIYDMEGNKLDKNKLEAMDKQAGLKAEEAEKEMVELGKTMAAAEKDAGIKEGQRPTKAQEKAMEASMQNAMFPRMKQKFLAHGKALRFGKECLSDADTLKEAKICTHKMDEMRGESSNPEDELRDWNAKTKKETLGFMEEGLKKMKCVEKVNNMQDMKQCMQ